MFRTILFKIALGLYFTAWTPLLLIGLVSKKLSRKFVFADAAGVLVLARLICGIKYNVHYPKTEEDGIPAMPDGNKRIDGKSIVAAKHMSILEIAVISRVMPKTFFIMKRELLWIPIYGWAFWRCGMLGVNRARGKTNMTKLSDDVEKRVLDGYTLVIFPEGTRAKPGERIPLKRGLLLLAYRLKLPIQPVGTDAGLYWPKHGRMHSGTANVWFEPLLPCNASLDEISDAINRHSA
ncbi:MAG: 1-acyl-sn-glycerol-3-phosphate acyltransferase [Alphaproteobacteria bacterium]|nr:1-acyl-sn-glycerol-3-phosphate acyltransferase [Alphaproteobacteria bacterium]